MNMYDGYEKKIVSKALFYTMGLPIIGMFVLAVCWNMYYLYQKEYTRVPIIKKIVLPYKQDNVERQKYIE